MNKEYVIRKNHQFQDIIGKRNQIVSKELIIYKVKNDLNHLRIGISVSKKFANAVGRNRYRRQTRASLDIVNLFNEIPYDIVIILRKPFLKLKFEKMAEVLDKQLKRINSGK